MKTTVFSGTSNIVGIKPYTVCALSAYHSQKQIYLTLPNNGWYGWSQHKTQMNNDFPAEIFSNCLPQTEMLNDNRILNYEFSGWVCRDHTFYYYKTQAWNHRKMMNKKIFISYPILSCKWLTCSVMRSVFGFHYSKDLVNNPLAKPQFNLSKWLQQNNNGSDVHFDSDSDWIRTILLWIHAFSEISRNGFWKQISALAARAPSYHHFYYLVMSWFFFLIFHSIVLSRSSEENWIVQWICSWNTVYRIPYTYSYRCNPFVEQMKHFLRKSNHF